MVSRMAGGRRVERFLRLVIGAVLLVLTAAANAAGSDGPPKSNGVFEERNPTTGAYTELERITPIQRVKSHLMYITGVSAYLEFPGARSLVRFHGGDNVEFIVREDRPNSDAHNSLEFYRLLTQGDNRALVLENLPGLIPTKGSSLTDRDYAVAFTATHFGEHLIKLTPDKPLAPGEYTVSARGTSDGFCFGVDP